MTLVDARGVAIEPGDTVIYGFGVSRSVAMAEGVVLERPCLDEECDGGNDDCIPDVSLTPSGRVRVRVVRRSYSSGEKPIVDVAPDRLVVLKSAKTTYGGSDIVALLPASPLPTQGETVRAELERSIERYIEALRDTTVPYYWERPEGVGEATADALALAEYHAFCAKRLRSLRRKLKDLDS